MTRKTLKKCAIGSAVAGLTLLSDLAAPAAVTYRTVALIGDAVPGADPGVVFSGFGSTHPVINAAGQTAFNGRFSGPGIDDSNRLGILSEGGGTLSVIARSGDAAPGTKPGVNFSAFFVSNSPLLNDRGQIAFRGVLTGSGVDNSNDVGIWSEGSGSLGLIAREGHAAPNTGPGVVYANFIDLVLNGAGQTAFVADLVGQDVDGLNNAGIWSEGSGSLRLIVRSGDHAPGTGPGVVLSGFEHFTPMLLNDAGKTAFFSFLLGPGVTPSNDTGIWSDVDGSLSLVVRAIEPAPGSPLGVSYNLIVNPRINNADQIAFRSILTDPGVNDWEDGLWLTEGGLTSPIVRTGDAAPGTTAGVRFRTFTGFLLNGAGQISFKGWLTGPGVDETNSSGIWLGDPSGLPSLIVRAGDHAPGTDAGVRFKAFAVDSVLNGSGQIASRGLLTGPGVNATNQNGIWATDPNGQLKLIARTGDLFDVNDSPLIDDFRTISLIDLVNFSGGEDGRASSFNDAGQLVLRLEFTDDTEGIFVATVPEPGTVGLLALTWGLDRCRRKRS